MVYYKTRVHSTFSLNFKLQFCAEKISIAVQSTYGKTCTVANACPLLTQSARLKGVQNLAFIRKYKKQGQIMASGFCAILEPV